MPRPATQNQADLATARKLLTDALHLIEAVAKREQVSDARTGKPDPRLRGHKTSAKPRRARR